MSDGFLGFQVHKWDGPPPGRARNRVSIYTKPGIATVAAIIDGHHADTITVNGTSYFADDTDAGDFIANARAAIGTRGSCVFAGSTFTNQLLINFEVTSIQAVVAFHNPADAQAFAPAWRVTYTFAIVEKT